jgi:hypothetical protein
VDEPLETLVALVASGADAADAAAAAAELLADARVTAAADDSPDALIADAMGRWQVMETESRAAWARYPGLVQSGGAHRVDADPRSMALFATPTYIRKAGFYEPEELAAMRDAGTAPASWAARECLRISAFLISLETLVRGLDDGTVGSHAYADEVYGLADRFAHMDVARAPAA